MKTAHVKHNSGNNEWYTPLTYIDAARKVMGGIDLDPASSDIANQTIKATKYYTAQNDGLIQKWDGRIWMNPPYAQPLIYQFCKKLTEEFGNTVTEACVLVNNATETKWFHTLLQKANAVCFPLSRIKFMNKEGNASATPLQGQAVLYFGEHIELFHNVFNNFGIILYTGVK